VSAAKYETKRHVTVRLHKALCKRGTITGW
jgi:hypothetical protein